MNTPNKTVTQTETVKEMAVILISPARKNKFEDILGMHFVTVTFHRSAYILMLTKNTSSIDAK